MELISKIQALNLYRLKYGQANGVPFDQKRRICRNRGNRTVYPLTQTLFWSQKKLTDAKPSITNVYVHILFLKNFESLQII